MAGFRAGVADYLRDRLWFLAFAAAVLAAGVTAGALAAGGLQDAERSPLAGSLLRFLGDLAAARDGLSGGELLRWSLAQHLRTAALLWLLGVTVVGFPAVLAVVFGRGFTIGFTVGFLVRELGVAGVAVAAAGVLPQNLLVIPALLVQSVAALSFSLMLFRNRFGREQLRFYHELAGYTLLVAAASAPLLAAALLQSFVSPVFLRLAASLV